MIRNYCIGDNVNRRRREVGAQHCILTSRGAERDRASEQNLGETGLLPYIRNTYSGVNVPEHPLQELVCQNAGCIGKAEQAMIGENCADAE